MSSFPVIENKRFFPFRLNSLIDKWSHKVNEVSEDLPDEPKPIADFVIENHTYPMHRGKPDDTHKLNCFHGYYCKTIEKDFWQYPQETLVFGKGDCEDTSYLTTALMGKILNANQVYEVLGIVKDAGSEKTLGGHGWVYAKYDDSWHYIESTRKYAPERYPEVSDIRKPYVYKGWKLIPYTIFNWSRFEEFKEGLTAYLDLDFEEKETREKYQALEEMNRGIIEPLEKAGILSKLRW